MSDKFLYDGRGLTRDEFSAYVRAYDFGSLPPNFIVLHHTAIPDTAETPIDDNPANDWPEGYHARSARLQAIRNYYQNQLGWDRGPHLFIDDQWIWLFTPMWYPGIHAGPANHYYRDGRLSYSIGIEVVGYYDNARWSEAVAQNVAHAVCALHKRLGTFDLTYKLGAGGISMHRDYSTKSCPGWAIVPSYFIPLFRGYSIETDIPKRWRVLSHVSNNPTWNLARIFCGPTTHSPVAYHLDRWWIDAGTPIEVGKWVPDQHGAKDEDGRLYQWAWLSSGEGFVRGDLVETY
jgi:hypothetical protein